jgi:hypothetical protein
MLHRHLSSGFYVNLTAFHLQTALDLKQERLTSARDEPSQLCSSLAAY